MTARVESILDDLRSKHERVTPARRAVIEQLDRAAGHLTAEDLVQAVQRTEPSVHLATIYRTLDVLERAGVVEHTHLGHGRAVYHLADNRHAHLVCETCGCVVEVSSKLLATVERRAREEHGFELRPHHFALVGRCQECQTRKFSGLG